MGKHESRGGAREQAALAQRVRVSVDAPDPGSVDGAARRAGARRLSRRSWRHTEACHADPAPRRDLPGERLLRPLLRDLSARRQPAGRAAVRGREGTPSVNGFTPFLTLLQPQPGQSDPPPALAGADLRPGPRLHGRAEGLRRRPDGRLRPVDRRHRSRMRRPSRVMDYFDGNTVTALWNYAQHYALSDNTFGTTFGQSTVGALNLVSGQTHGATSAERTRGRRERHADPGRRPGPRRLLVGIHRADDRPHDRRRPDRARRHVGLVPGRLRPTHWRQGLCDSHRNIGGTEVVDYIPHHEPFQYYASTANPHHLPPRSTRRSAGPTRPTTSTT